MAGLALTVRVITYAVLAFAIVNIVIILWQIFRTPKK